MPDLQVPRTAFLPANIDACALYRMFLPHLHTPNSLFLFRPDRLHMDELAPYEVVVVQRQVTPANLRAMQLLKKNGKKVVYDLDDDMWSLPSTNPAQKLFQQMQDGFSICAQEADLVTVSTRGLKTAVRGALPHLDCEILVTPNGIDFDLFYPTPLDKEDGRVMLGWAGSNTHAGDIKMVWDLLPSLMQKHPDLWLECVGMLPPRILQDHPRVKGSSWVPVGEFPNRFAGWSWDISMAPLDNIRFNRSKSSIKALEAAAMKIPCLMSNVSPYAEFCALGGKELEWLLCETPGDWATKLEKLVSDPDYRKSMGELMYKIARQFFDIEKLKDNWAYALRKVVGWN